MPDMATASSAGIDSIFIIPAPDSADEILVLDNFREAGMLLPTLAGAQLACKNKKARWRDGSPPGM